MWSYVKLCWHNLEVVLAKIMTEMLIGKNKWNVLLFVFNDINVDAIMNISDVDHSPLWFLSDEPLSGDPDGVAVWMRWAVGISYRRLVKASVFEFVLERVCVPSSVILFQHSRHSLWEVLLEQLGSRTAWCFISTLPSRAERTLFLSPSDSHRHRGVDIKWCDRI